jgi:hypothetical protein
MMASKSSTAGHLVARVMKGKENFKTGLKRYLNTHFFYGADEFFIFKNYLQSFKQALHIINQ